MAETIKLTAEDGHTFPLHLYPAGHGFSCDERGSYHEPSAKLARQRTLEFLAEHMGRGR